MDNMQRIKERILKMSWGKYEYEEELGDQKWHQHFWSFASSAFSFCNFVLVAKVPLVLHCWHFYGDVIANWIAPTNKIPNDIFPFHRNDLRIVSSPNRSMLRSHHLHIAPSLDRIWISFLFLKKIWASDDIYLDSAHWQLQINRRQFQISTISNSRINQKSN